MQLMHEASWFQIVSIGTKAIKIQSLKFNQMFNGFWKNKE